MLTLPFRLASVCARASGMNTLEAPLPALTMPTTLKLVLATETVEPTLSFFWVA